MQPDLSSFCLYMHKMFQLSPRSKQLKTRSASHFPYSPTWAHIFLLSLSIYFLPLPSASPPLLNPSSSHLQGSHPSFVLLPPPPTCLCLYLCFLSTSAGGSRPQHFSSFSSFCCFAAPHTSPLHLHPIFPLLTLHLWRGSPVFSPSVLSPSSFFCLTLAFLSHCSILVVNQFLSISSIFWECLWVHICFKNCRRKYPFALFMACFDQVLFITQGLKLKKT